MDLGILQQIGLNKSEIKVYVTLLELGSSTTGPLMDKAKVSSSKIYGILSRLIEKGLVSSITKSKTKYYQASNPDSLMDYFKEKEAGLKFFGEGLKKIIPELKAKQAVVENRQEAQVYLGWKGIMSAYSFMLDNMKKGEDYIAFAQTSIEEESKEVKLFFSQFQKKREEKMLKVKLVADSSQKRVFGSEPYNKFKNFSVRYAKNCPPGIVIGKSHIFISAFEVFPVGVVITSRQIADAYRKYFYSMWEMNG